MEVLAKPPGLWESLQAIARLAHRGCRAGTLRVPPFNGRLFSPAHAPLAESAALDDGAVREALLALTTRAGTRRQAAHRVRGPRGRAARRRLRTDPRLRAGCRNIRGPWPPDARARRTPQDDRRLLHAPRAHGVPGPPDARAARARRHARSHPVAARARPGDGQRRVPGGGVPLPRARVRGRADSRRRGVGRGSRRRGSVRLSARRRAALSLRRGHQPDGRAARTAVAVAGHARRRPSPHVPGSSSPHRQQPRRRLARRPGPAAASRAIASGRSPAVRARRRRRRHRRDHRTPPVDCQRSRRHHRAGSREGAADGVAGARGGAAHTMEGRSGLVVRRLVPRRSVAPARRRLRSRPG